jgi:transcription elongation GreA/GreB family factor
MVKFFRDNETLSHQNIMITPPRRRYTRSQKIDDSPIPLTPAAHERMQERLARLKASLPALAEEAQRTAAYGDRSDSAEYKEAKGLLRRTHRQIFSLEDQFKRVTIIPVGPNTSGTVQLGCTVVLESPTAKTLTTFQILGPYETSPGSGRISHQSPLGAALMGHAVGDTVSIETANGERTYRIVEIR